jgi:malate/lactate dehydrogenase
MATVAILGAGDIGGACAQALAVHDRVGHILVIDSAVNAAAGKALDIQQAGAISGSHARLQATDDESRAVGCAACVIADRFAAGSPDWQGEEGLALIKRVAGLLPDAPIIFAGATQADLIQASSREARVPARRLIGSATEAFASAVAAIVAMEARCSVNEVSLAVLGTPPASRPERAERVEGSRPERAERVEGFVVPWSDASIGGYALERVVSQVQLRSIEARVARLWPPGPHALGAAAARVVEALLQASRRSYNVLTVLGGEFGVRDRIGAVPALLASHGVVHTRVPALNTRERVQLETALGV